MMLGGRGSGKTAGGVHTTMEHLRRYGSMAWATVVAPTGNDIKQVCLEGPSGMWTHYRQEFKEYNRSERTLVHIGGGHVRCFSADEPDRLRGPQHTFLWFDELSVCKEAAWDNAFFGLRLGESPIAVVTMTPRPRSFIKKILEGQHTIVTRGTTYSNPHLSAEMRSLWAEKYGGTRLGRQELDGELLEDVEGALWNRQWIDENRVRPEDVPELVYVVVAVDPNGGTKPKNAETGIACVGRGIDGNYYLLASEGYRVSPLVWAAKAMMMYDRFKANELFAERNYGGDMVVSTLQTAAGESVDRYCIKCESATRGKDIRAEPIAALAEQGRFRHVGEHPEVEDQMCRFTVEDELLDRLDSVVWAARRAMEAQSSLPIFIRRINGSGHSRRPV